MLETQAENSGPKRKGRLRPSQYRKKPNITVKSHCSLYLRVLNRIYALTACFEKANFPPRPSFRGTNCQSLELESMFSGQNGAQEEAFPLNYLNYFR